MLHVVPVGDVVEHTSEDDCVCGPTAKLIKGQDGSTQWIMIHHSLDGREIEEPDREA